MRLIESLKLTKARTVFAAMFYSTYLAMVFFGKEIPGTLENLVISLMSFYFGQRAASVMADKAKD